MQQLDEQCVGLAFHLGQGGRPPAADATPLRLSRALEQRVADAEGPADVRHWLQLIGHGEELEWIDLATVAGYRRVVFCQSVRDDVEGALGPGAWADLLPRMCEGRLVPTPWLNKVRRWGWGKGELIGGGQAHADWRAGRLAGRSPPASPALATLPIMCLPAHLPTCPPAHLPACPLPPCRTSASRCT